MSHGVSRDVPPEAPDVPDYELLRRIGEGSYGEVWLARGVTGVLRAVKVVYRDRFDSDHPFNREFAGIQRYESVSRAHESLVHLLHVGRNAEKGYFYYVMELADDASGAATVEPQTYVPHTLRWEVETRKRLPPGECLKIGTPLADALDSLHKQGLVHRDVKPSNVIFVDGLPKLADIGLVAEAGAAYSFVGTEGYVPPAGPGSPAADIYGLGKVLYELCTGLDRLRFPEFPTELQGAEASHMLRALNRVVLKACENNVGKGYKDAAQLRAALSAAGALPVTHPSRHRRPFALAAAGVLAVALTALAISLLRQCARQVAPSPLPAAEELDRAKVSGVTPEVRAVMAGAKLIQSMHVPRAEVALDGLLDSGLFTTARRDGRLVIWDKPLSEFQPTRPKQWDGRIDFSVDVRLRFAAGENGGLFVGAFGHETNCLVALAPFPLAVDADGRLVWQQQLLLDMTPGMTALHRILCSEYVKMKCRGDIVRGGMPVGPDWLEFERRQVRRDEWASCIVNYCDEPVHVVYHAMVCWGANDSPGPQSEFCREVAGRWWPRPPTEAGECERTMTLSYEGVRGACYFGHIGIDNGNPGEVSIEGERIARDRWGDTLSMHVGPPPRHIRLKGTAQWSTFQVQFGMAVAADEVTVVDKSESPGTGMRKNPGPMVMTIAPALSPGGQECVLSEDWEQGVDGEKWVCWGQPMPRIVVGAGRNGSNALDCGGDGVGASGVLSVPAFRLADYPVIEFWAKGRQTGHALQWIIGQFVYGAEDAYRKPEEWGSVANPFGFIRVGAERQSDVVTYGLFGLRPGFEEPYPDDEWHQYRIAVEPGGRIAFSRDGHHKWTSSRRIDLESYGSLPVMFGGASKGTTNLIDDIRITLRPQSDPPPAPNSATP